MPRPSNPHPYRKSVTHYVAPDGRRCKSSDPGAVKRVVQTRTYYADLPGAPNTPLGTSNEAEAWNTLREMLRRQHEEALGIRDSFSEHAKTPLRAHLDEWAALLASKGTTAKQIELAKGRLVRLAELAGWKRLQQITYDSAMLALAKVQKPVAEDGLGKSAATRNHYLGHLKAFVSWCHDGGRMKSNPIRKAQKVNTETDRRHMRRAPSEEEVAELCRWLAAANRPVRKRLTSRERRLGYLVSMTTGLRAGELRSLTPASFRLDEGVVKVPAGYSKRRRLDTQRLPRWLVEELRDWFAAGGGWGWQRLNRNGAGRVLKADLRDCRRDWIAAAANEEERAEREASNVLCWRTETPEGPRFCDYHSLRHASVTKMSNLPGMDLKTLLSLTRLSSAELALKTYSHGEEERLRAAVEQQKPPA